MVSRSAVGVAAAFGAVALALGAGAVLGIGTAFLLVGGAVLLSAILLFWSSLQGLSGASALSLGEALDIAMPSAPEQQKRAVLKALKDLEYERAVGKLSEEDYRELSTRYRAEARQLLQQLDHESAQAKAEAESLVAERLGRPGAEADPERSGDHSAEPTPPSLPVCAACDTSNDSDARFCKGCGATLEEVP